MSSDESIRGESLIEPERCWIVDLGSLVEWAVCGVVLVEFPALRGAGRTYRITFAFGIICTLTLDDEEAGLLGFSSG